MTRRAVVLMAAALAACGPARPQAPRPLSESEKAGYLAAPQVQRVVAGADGAPVAEGLTHPASRVRATLPSGEAYGATADSQGRFALGLPTTGESLLVRIWAEEGGRSTPAEGWLFAPAGDYAHAALLRPGSTTRSLAARPGLIAAVDFDAAGGAGVSGAAPAGSEVRPTIDGQPAGQARADARGRYGIRLNRAPAGLHRLRAVAGAKAQERNVLFAPAPAAGAYVAVRAGDGWRIDWTPPGGGSQTTFLFGGAGS
jgi:hypothetical protein